MSLFREMLEAARQAPAILGEATDLVSRFLSRCQNQDGGFRDRDGRSDLYYTAFALAAIAALHWEGRHPAGAPSTGSAGMPAGTSSTGSAGIPAGTPGSLTLAGKDAGAPSVAGVRRYLRTFGGGEGLDFVHLCCLARSWRAAAILQSDEGCEAAVRAGMLRRLQTYRSADGGFHPVAGSAHGTAYAAFLALGAFQDLNADLPEPLRLAKSLQRLATSEGAWTNERHGPPVPAATNATAAAIAVLRHLGEPIQSTAGQWLLARAHPQGGFLAAPSLPMPDLLSTATALHALAHMQVPFTALREPCLDFIDSLWTNEGGFYGHWADDHVDCEYTFYALLALGHLG